MPAASSLIDFLHLSLLTTRTGVLRFQNEAEGALIYLNHGNIVHAQWGNQSGTQAFWSLVGIPNAAFTFEENARVPERTIDRPTELLLIEAHQHAGSSSLSAQVPPPASHTSPASGQRPKLRRTSSIVFDLANDEKRKIHLLEPGTVVVGRSNDCDLVINDQTVSRRHFQLDVGQDHIILTNLSAGNGTLVNNQRTHEPFVLRENDQIQAGLTKFRFYRTIEFQAALIQECHPDDEDALSAATGIIPS